MRLIGPGADGVLLPKHCRLEDGSDARVLDILRVGLYAYRPTPHHPENWRVDGTPWELIRRPAGKDSVPLLRAHLARGPDLLGDRENRRPVKDFEDAPAPGSLALVYARELRWHTALRPRGTRRPRVRFAFHGTEYDLPLTDPEWRQRVEALPSGLHPATAAGLGPDDRVLLTVSLGEPFVEDDCCYKLVAAVIVLSREWRGVSR